MGSIDEWVGETVGDGAKGLHAGERGDEVR